MAPTIPGVPMAGGVAALVTLQAAARTRVATGQAGTPDNSRLTAVAPDIPNGASPRQLRGEAQDNEPTEPLTGEVQGHGYFTPLISAAAAS